MRVNVSAADLIRREVLVSLFVVAVASTGMGMVTWASFSDSDDSARNHVESGSLDLSLDGSNGVAAAFSITNGGPGSAAGHNFTVRNEGSLAADHLEITLSFAENDSSAEPTDPDLDAELNASETASLVSVTQVEYRDSGGETIYDVLGSVSDRNGNGIVDLEDVQSQSGQLDDLPAPRKESGNSTYFVVTVAIADDGSAQFDAGNNTDGNLTGYDEDIMADGIDVEFTFTLNQAAGQ